MVDDYSEQNSKNEVIDKINTKIIFPNGTSGNGISVNSVDEFIKALKNTSNMPKGFKFQISTFDKKCNKVDRTFDNLDDIKNYANELKSRETKEKQQASKLFGISIK